MERVFPRRRTPHEQKLRSFTSRIHQISNVHRDAMRCGSIRIRFDSRNCCPTRDSPSRLQYTASLTAELNIYNADSECQNCIDCTNWRTNLPHFSYLAARSDAMVPNRLVGIGIQCLPRMPAHGHNRDLKHRGTLRRVGSDVAHNFDQIHFITRLQLGARSDPSHSRSLPLNIAETALSRGVMRFVTFSWLSHAANLNQ